MICYKLLLIKYMAVVGEMEGVTFRSEAREPYFTPEELAELREIEEATSHVIVS